MEQNKVAKVDNKLASLAKDLGLNAKIDLFNKIINNDPLPAWIQNHPLDKSIRYIPIARIEALLRTIFGRFEVKVKDFRVIANSVAVCVTLRVLDPLTGEWMEQDGLGAVDIQVKKGANATDFTQINHFAVMKGLPAAKSFAIKDAAELFGKIFGSDLNRKDEIAFEPKYAPQWADDKIEKVQNGTGK